MIITKEERKKVWHQPPNFHQFIPKRENLIPNLDQDMG